MRPRPPTHQDSPAALGDGESRESRRRAECCRSEHKILLPCCPLLPPAQCPSVPPCPVPQHTPSQRCPGVQPRAWCLEIAASHNKVFVSFPLCVILAQHGVPRVFLVTMGLSVQRVLPAESDLFVAKVLLVAQGLCVPRILPAT